VKYKVAGPHAICGVATGGTVTAEQIVAGGGSVQHLIDTGHIVVAQESSKPVAKMTTKKAFAADEKTESEETD
jgi:hypothetical protein